MQDFRRAPHIFYYGIEKCKYVDEFGNWDACPDGINCIYSHSLMEQLYNPLNYKQHACPYHQNASSCPKPAYLCAYNHSEEDKKTAEEAIQITPKILLEDYDDKVMETFRERKNNLNPRIDKDLFQLIKDAPCSYSASNWAGNDGSAKKNNPGKQIASLP